MGLIREPLEVDFVVDPRPLNKKEKQQISEYIRAYKAQHSKKNAKKQGKRSASIRKNATT